MAYPPGPPLIVSRPDAESESITFFWSPPLSNGSPPITSYLLSSISHNCNILLDSNIIDNSNNSAEYRISGLSNNILYSFQVAASNSINLGPFAQFTPVRPGTEPLDPTFSTTTFNNYTGNTDIRWTVNSTINTSRVNYNIATAYREGETIYDNISSVTKRIYRGEEISTNFQLNRLNDWKICVQSVADSGYSSSNNICNLYFDNPQTIFYQYSEPTSNSAFFYNTYISTISPYNDISIPNRAEWGGFQANPHRLGLLLMLRNNYNNSTFQMYAFNNDGVVVNSSIVFSTFSTMTTGAGTNVHGTLGTRQYGFYQDIRNNISYYVYDYNLNKFYYSSFQASTIQNVTGGILTSNFYVIATSTTNTSIFNLFGFEYNSNDPADCHIKYINTFGSFTLRSNVLLPKFYIFARDSLSTTNIHTKLFILHSDTPNTFYNIERYGIFSPTVTNPTSPNKIVMVDNSRIHYTFNFDLPENQIVEYSNFFPGGTFCNIGTVYSPNTAGVSTVFGTHTFFSTANFLFTYSPYGPTRFFSTITQGTSATQASLPTFGVSRTFASNTGCNTFSMIDNAGNFSTFITPFISSSTAGGQFSNNNSWGYCLRSPTEANSTVLYTFVQHNSNIFIHSTSIGTNFNISGQRTSNTIHNFIHFSSATSNISVYLRPGLPPSTLGSDQAANLGWNSLTPSQDISFGIEQTPTQSRCFIYSNATFISTVQLGFNPNMGNNTTFTFIRNNDCIFLIARTGFTYYAFSRISSSGLYLTARTSNVETGGTFPPMATVTAINSSGTKRGMVVHLTCTSTIAAVDSTIRFLAWYNWTNNSFEYLSSPSFGFNQIYNTWALRKTLP